MSAIVLQEEAELSKVGEEGGGLRRCGDGWRAVPVSQILEHVVEVVALFDLQVVERIQEHQQSGRYSCWQQRRAFFAVPQFLFLDRVMDIPVDETGTHSANCSKNRSILRWWTSL